MSTLNYWNIHEIQSENALERREEKEAVCGLITYV